MFNKSCRWLDLNPGPLVTEETALPTAPQPLPRHNHCPATTTALTFSTILDHNSSAFLSMTSLLSNSQGLPIFDNQSYLSFKHRPCLGQTQLILLHFPECTHKFSYKIDKKKKREGQTVLRSNRSQWIHVHNQLRTHQDREITTVIYLLFGLTVSKHNLGYVSNLISIIALQMYYA